MTVLSTASSSGPYLANGSTQTFPFTFAVRDVDEVQVLVDGLEVEDFEVALNSDYNGGSVTFAATSGGQVLVQANPSFEQEIAFQDGGPFLPSVMDEALDRAAIKDIRLKAEVENLTNEITSLRSAIDAGVLGNLLTGSADVYLLSTLPDPSTGIRVGFVTDALNGSGGAGQLAYSNGVQWVDFRGIVLQSAPLSLIIPYGAAALWEVNQYQASPSPVIPNGMTTKAVSKNLLRYPRRSFASLYFLSSVTAVDGGVADPFGGIEASTVAGTGNWKILPNSPQGVFPAGTYTLACWARRNVGTDQPFGFTTDTGTTRSVQTATAAWQRFTYTFTLTGDTFGVSFGLVSSDGSTAANIQIIDFELFAGSADLGLGVNNTAGHAYFGDSAYQTQTYAAGVKTGGYASINLDTTFPNTAFSFVCLAKINALNTFNGLLADLNSFGPLKIEGPASTGLGDITASGTLFKNLVAADTSTAADAWQYPVFQNTLDGKYHQYGFTYQSGVIELWINDVRFARWEKAVPAYTFANLWFNAINAGNPSGNTLAGFSALWPRKLSSSEMRSVFARNKLVATTDGVTITSDTSDRILAIEGDSITTSDVNYAGIFCGAHDNPAVWASMWAVTGSALVNLNQRAPYVDAMLPPSKNGRTFLFSVMIGANDLGTYAGGAAQYITDLRAYCSARANAGWKVALGTILPISGATAHNAARATVNADIRANWARYGLTSSAAIFDFAADSIMGPDNSFATNPTYWQGDGKHPSALGQAQLEPIYRAVINAL